MVTTDTIRASNESGLECRHVEVRGAGQQYEALLVSNRFDGLSRVRRHQLVYGALGDRMRDEIHALSMSTLTPAEWSSKG